MSLELESVLCNERRGEESFILLARLNVTEDDRGEGEGWRNI